MRHARRCRTRWVRVGAGVVAAVVVGAVAALGAFTSTALNATPADADEVELAIEPLPEEVAVLPVPEISAREATLNICTLPDVITALESGNDNAVVRAAGGGEAFRAAVVSGAADCISLSAPDRLWMVANKVRPLDPLRYHPDDLVRPSGVRIFNAGLARVEAAQALTNLVEAAAEEGVGEIAQLSGYRSYDVQVRVYNGHVADRGTAGADEVSARPGHSEHQTGLTVDVVACDAGRCGTIYQIAGTRQGDWVAENAWRFGWVVRYEEGYTDITGYTPEPWHLRYVGTELAAAYHAGGWHTLEDFFDLPAAPDYTG